MKEKVMICSGSDGCNSGLHIYSYGGSGCGDQVPVVLAALSMSLEAVVDDREMRVTVVIVIVVVV